MRLRTYLAVPLLAAYVIVSSGCAKLTERLKDQPILSNKRNASTEQDYTKSCNQVSEYFKLETTKTDKCELISVDLPDSYKATIDLLAEMNCSKNLIKQAESAYVDAKNSCGAYLSTQSLEKTISCISKPAIVKDNCIYIIGENGAPDEESCFPETVVEECAVDLMHGGPNSFKNCYLLISEIEDSISASEAWGVKLPDDVVNRAFAAADKKCVHGSFNDVDKDYAGPSSRDAVVKQFRDEFRPLFNHAEAKIKNIRKTQHR